MSDSAKPSILITGGAGFVGRVFCKEFIKSFPLSRRVLIARNPSTVVDGWETMHADLSDFDAMRRIVGEVKPDIVLHLAAQSSVADSQRLAEETWRTNFIGTMALASATSQLAPSALFLFVSSGEVYGANLQSGCCPESVDPQPQNPYSSSKLAAERVLRDVLGPQNKLIIVRPFNHTGPGHDRRFVLPSFAAQIVEVELGAREPVIRVGNLDAKRDFLHVDDVVAAYLGLIKVAPILPHFILVNVCSGEALPVKFYLDEMLKMANLNIEVVPVSDKMRPSDIACSCGDNSLLRSLIGWSPTISPIGLCEDLLSYWRTDNA